MEKNKKDKIIAGAAFVAMAILYLSAMSLMIDKGDIADELIGMRWILYIFVMYHLPCFILIPIIIFSAIKGFTFTGTYLACNSLMLFLAVAYEYNVGSWICLLLISIILFSLSTYDSEHKTK